MNKIYDTNYIHKQRFILVSIVFFFFFFVTNNSFVFITIHLHYRIELCLFTKKKKKKELSFAISGFLLLAWTVVILKKLQGSCIGILGI
jgi:hypothetical protein